MVPFAQGPVTRCDLLMTSFTLDTSGLELRLFAKEVRARRPAIFVCDAPVEAVCDKFVEEWVTEGWAVVSEVIVAT